MTDDLPTPPLPEATDTTRVVGGIIVSGAFSRAFQRALLIAAAFSSASSSVQSIPTSVTPGIEPMRLRTSRWIWPRNGQPAVVSATVTRTAPSSPMRTPFTIPRSTMSLPSSGSMTPRSTAVTSSGEGLAAVTAWVSVVTGTILPDLAV